jgi:hypothetical protein
LKQFEKKENIPSELIVDKPPKAGGLRADV